MGSQHPSQAVHAAAELAAGDAGAFLGAWACSEDPPKANQAAKHSFRLMSMYTPGDPRSARVDVLIRRPPGWGTAELQLTEHD
jgi:hypothetical protein